MIETIIMILFASTTALTLLAVGVEMDLNDNEQNT
jgi:hypothetical protein